MDKHRRDESPSGLSDIVEPDGLLGTGLTVSSYFFLRCTLTGFLPSGRLIDVAPRGGRVGISRPLGGK